MKLRLYQETALTDVRQAFAEGFKAPLLIAPTGAGKTVMFSRIAFGAAAKGHSVLILAHRRELIRQASQKLVAAGVEHGLIAPGFTPSYDLVKVGSVQTLVRRLHRPEAQGFRLIIIDEAHHAVAGQWLKIIEANPQAKILGVTATGERPDGKGLGVHAGGVFDTLVNGPRIADLMAEGYLVTARTFAPGLAANLATVKTKDGDYDVDALAAAMDVPTITGSAVSHYARVCPGVPAIAFCCNRAHAEDTAAAFRAAGWRAAYADGTMPIGQRDAALNGLGNGSVQVLCVCDLISEGVDIPDVACVISLRPTQSIVLWVQQLGRGLRCLYAPGYDLETISGRLAAIANSSKPALFVLDHAGNSENLRHLPETHREWSLDGRCKRDKGPSPFRRCPTCYAVHPPRPTCPSCGFDYRPDDEAEAVRLAIVEGELREIDAAAKARIEELSRGKLADVLTGKETLPELHEIAKARGLRSGWAWNEFQRNLKDRKKAA